MARARVVALLLLFLFAAGACRAALPPPVARAFADAGIPLASVGIVVQEVAAPRPVLTHQAGRAYNPASVMKLITTFAALELLGPEHRWKTEAYLAGPLVDGVLRGDLVLKGGGDPKITVEQWRAFMASLRAQGLSAVDGDLVLDRSYFAPIAHRPGAFDGEPLKPYNVGPDALLVNFKAVKFAFAPDVERSATQLTIEPPLARIAVTAPPTLGEGECGDWHRALGALFVDRGGRATASFAGRYAPACGEREWWVALLDAPTYVHGMFEAYFREAGGRFGGSWKPGLAPRNATPFATLVSPPLWDIVRDVNKLSNNVMARQVFLTLATVGAPPPATTAGATAVVRRWLVRRNLRMPELVLDNGSGLSRRERISAGSLARLLLAADASAVREEFASSLAVAATDGTVQRRFHDRSVAGHALLKTGSLEGVRSLAGYVLAADGRRYAVAAIVNHPNAAGAAAALDGLVQWVHRDAGSAPPLR
jgi:D-alanyl-D-alanine carboxypeptidase/D-alanyl-D-alanine-endopeptidase (penicillin-binding protein 4)